VAAGWNKPASPSAEKDVERSRKPDDGTKRRPGAVAKKWLRTGEVAKRAKNPRVGEARAERPRARSRNEGALKRRRRERMNSKS
jgi:hypothetical protein